MDPRLTYNSPRAERPQQQPTQGTPVQLPIPNPYYPPLHTLRHDPRFGSSNFRNPYMLNSGNQYNTATYQAQWAQYVNHWRQWYQYHQQVNRLYAPQQSVNLNQQPSSQASLSKQESSPVPLQSLDSRLTSVKYDAKKRIAAMGGTRFSDTVEPGIPTLLTIPTQPPPAQQAQTTVQPRRPSRFAQHRCASPSPLSVVQKRMPSNSSYASDHQNKRWLSEPVVSEQSSESTRQEFVGVCETLEKSYFRLTSEADPLLIRPLNVLQRAFEFVVNKASVGENLDFGYLSDQLRSIRQDMTVQNIKTEFTTKVYETNALIALEMGDREEFNQCQTQLVSLYAQGLDIGNSRAFARYRLLYNMFIEDRAGAIRALSALLETSLTGEDEQCVRLYQSFTLKAFGAFFRIVRSLPPKCAIRSLVGIFAGHYRRLLLISIFKTMRPRVSLDYLSKSLGFADKQSCIEMLTHLKIGRIEDCDGGDEFVECRNALAVLNA